MPEQSLSFFARLGLACSVLRSGEFAARVALLRHEKALPPPAEPARAPAPEKAAPDVRAALQLLAMLQSSGRFVDFLEEDIATFSDAEVGSAARVVHEGCRKALREHVTIEPIRLEPEGATVTLDAGYDATAHKLTGNVRGSAPYRGTLHHRGWRAKDVRLPELLAADASVLAPAEVEL